MKKKSSIKYLIAFISVGFLIPLGISLACGYSDMDDSDVISFFSPEVIISESFKPFFRSINPFYSIRFKEDNIKDFDQKNIEDWYSYFSNQVNKPDLSQLLYKTRIGQIDTLIRASFNKKTEVPFFLRRDTDKSVVKKYQIISKSGSINYIAQDTVPLIPDCLKGNSILSYLDKSKTIDFLNYLVFAKKCEPVSAVRTYFWYDQKDEEKAFKARRKILIRGLITEAGNLIPKIKRPDIKQRYLFQYERLYFFEGSYDTCLTVYLNNENQFIDSSAIKYRAMSYAAGALKRQHKTGYANYLYSVVYDNCDELKITAESGYSPGDETDWSLSLSMAKNVREKTVLWHMLGIKFDPVRAMKEIFSVDPSSNLLDLLLVRAVNIQEESVLPQDIHSTSSESKFLFRSENLDQELVKIVKTAADSKNTGNSFLWNLSAGYLAILSNDAANAVKYLRMAENMSLKDSLLFNQVKLASVIWKIDQIKFIDPSVENQIIDELLWLKKPHNPELRNERAFAWVKNRLSQVFIEQGDTIKSHCLRIYTDDRFYENDNKIRNLISFIDRQGKSRFDNFILNEYPFKKADLIELQATKLLYSGKIEEALEKFSTDIDAGKRMLTSDPFGIAKTDGDYKSRADGYVGTSKKAFLEKFLEIKNKKPSDSQAASENIFQLANALYNITYFGNSKLMYQTEIIGYGICFFGKENNSVNSFIGDNYSFRYQTRVNPDTENIKTRFGVEIMSKIKFVFDCSHAKELYIKAMNLSTNKEFKAKCCFMASKCEQNDFFINRPADYNGDFKSGKFFRTMKEKYSETAEFNDAIRECGYFKKFVSGE